MIKRMALKEARATGMHKFLPFKPCHRGHDGFRYAKTGACIDCVRLLRRGLRETETVVITAHPQDIAAIKAFAANLRYLRKIT